MAESAPTTTTATPTTGVPAPAVPQPGTPAPAPTGTPPAEGPQPVPYQVFAATNERMRAAEEKVTALQQQLEQFGPAKFQELTQQQLKTQSEAQLRVALARAGVPDYGLEYLLHQRGTLGESAPPVDEWIGQLRQTQPAWFTPAAPADTATPPAAPTSPAGQAPTPPPRTTSPDATSSATPPSGDPPLTDDVIKSMDKPTFARRWPEIEKFMKERGRAR